MYEGYQKIARGYRKCLEGIRNVWRVSEMLEGYRKCTKGIGKFKN